jgi:non-specific protein-tyrosine kinase
MEIRHYAGLLRKWLWLIVAATLLAGLIAFIVSRNSAPVYQASATLMVNQAASPTAAAGYSDILSSERLARTYANLLTSWPVVDETARRLGVESQVLQRTTAVDPVRDTQLLQIHVEGSNPEMIALAANTLPQVFIEQNREMQLGRLLESKGSLEREMAGVEADLVRAQAALDQATEGAERTRLEAELSQYRSTYSSLVASYQQVKLAEAQAVNNIVIAEPAKVPTTPIRPRTPANVMLAALIAALAATGAAFLFEYLDDTVKTADDVSRVAGLSTLGAIARLKETNGGPKPTLPSQMRAPESEAYRILRTNIQFAGVDQPVRTLLVTSAGPGEGKSTTAANLASVIAQTGQRVILVDTDLRRPTLHRIFNLPNHVGLTTALLSEGTVSLQPTAIENLHVLTSGPIPPNPSELLGSQRMRTLVEGLCANADIVICDSPPVLAVTDAAVLGRQVDGVLLVVDAEQTREQALAGAVAELQKTGAKVLGVAINRLDSRTGGQYAYYHYYSGETGDAQLHLNEAASGVGARLKLLRQRKAA